MRRKVILNALRAILLAEVVFIGLLQIYPGMIWFSSVRAI